MLVLAPGLPSATGVQFCSALDRVSSVSDSGDVPVVGDTLKHGSVASSMNHRLSVLATLWLLLMGAMASYAHHAFEATYEATEVELREVTIVRIAWINPHTIIELDAKDGAGGATRWVTETGSPSALTRAGWKRNALSTGDVVTVIFHPARDGTKRGHLLRVTFPDGTVLDRRGQ